MTSLSGAGHSSTYVYNGDGLRMSKTVDGVTTSDVWMLVGASLPVIVADKIGGTTDYYVNGGGGAPLEQIGGTTPYYYHSNMLGSIRRLTDAVGTVKQSYDYDPYGQPISLIVSIQNPYLFAGQYCDSESGLYYMRARYYDPNAGQFISRDPAVSRTRTAYSYASDSPINGTDPSGQCTAGLWHVAPALCLLEVLAPHLRGTPLASPLASASMAASSAVGAVQDHAVFGISECYGGCFNFQVQGGVASLQGGGVGYVWRGPYVGWANKKVRDRAKDSLVVSGCYYIGLSGSEGYPGGALPGDKADTEIDFTEGLGVQYGPMHTFASINLNPALGWVGSF